jgi:hypothetical protein
MWTVETSRFVRRSELRNPHSIACLFSVSKYPARSSDKLQRQLSAARLSANLKGVTIRGPNTWCAPAKYAVPLRNDQVMKLGARRETLPHNRLENNKDTDVTLQNQAQQIYT